jgi:hypothetical protein
MWTHVDMMTPMLRNVCLQTYYWFTGADSDTVTRTKCFCVSVFLAMFMVVHFILKFWLCVSRFDPYAIRSSSMEYEVDTFDDFVSCDSMHVLNICPL